jgi:hypothetical protein
MRDKDPLIPPISAICDRLTDNQRERRRLRTLLKLAVDEQDERRRRSDAAPRPQPETVRPGGAES